MYKTRNLDLINIQQIELCLFKEVIIDQIIKSLNIKISFINFFQIININLI